MAVHELKTWPTYFERVLSGEKTFEVRRDDRGFQMGDTLVLREYDPNKRHECEDQNCFQNRWTGRTLTFRAGFIFKAGVDVDLGQHVVISLLPVAQEGGDRG